LPTLQDSDLTLNNISLLDRYRALNEQVLRQRNGVEITLNINGDDHLQVSHKDVMLEAAATSLQIHIQVPQDIAARYYNASILLSAPMVAISANSPCLFGKRLWQETRIPVFEQAVPTGGYGGAAFGPVHRVSFGLDYARRSLFECFQENLEHYPLLLPVHYQDDIGKLKHLRLHNGTIWRWNRPLIGFDEDQTPHLRIEHRVCASAPSTVDDIANIAFYYGLVHFYATLDEPPENIMPFADAKSKPDGSIKRLILCKISSSTSCSKKPRKACINWASILKTLSATSASSSSVQKKTEPEASGNLIFLMHIKTMFL
jgi:hypothetical protein